MYIHAFNELGGVPIPTIESNVEPEGVRYHDFQPNMQKSPVERPIPAIRI